MNTRHAIFTLGLGIALCGAASAQTLPPRDPIAVAILQSSVAAMGASVPSDSVATGTVALVEGSKSDSGTISILTRATDQTAEEMQMADGQRAVVYSWGQASQIDGSTVKPLQMELAVTSQCPDFPLPLLARALSNPDFAFQYVGPETLGGVAVQHTRFWNTFASHPELQQLAEFSVMDLWVGTANGLSYKFAYQRRAAGGSAPRIPVEVYFSNYRNVGGVLYPFFIQKSFNGTPWATITVQSIAFNTGLTDANFPVQ